MYFKQNVQEKSFLQKLLLVNLMTIFNKNIFQRENMKSSFISIGNLIQNTKWCLFLKLSLYLLHSFKVTDLKVDTRIILVLKSCPINQIYTDAML